MPEETGMRSVNRPLRKCFSNEGVEFLVEIYMGRVNICCTNNSEEVQIPFNIWDEIQRYVGPSPDVHLKLDEKDMPGGGPQ